MGQNNQTYHKSDIVEIEEIDWLEYKLSKEDR